MPEILVVDDDQQVLESLCEELGDQYVVEAARSGEEALAKLHDRRFDAVISDVRMPGMGGVALLERVAELAPGTVRIFLTGYADEEVVHKALSTGAFKVRKPWGDELGIVLHHALAHRRLLGRLEHVLGIDRMLRDEESSEEALLLESIERLADERSEQEEALGRAREELRNLGRLAALGAIAASVAHDLRSPLLALIANQQVLEEELGEHADEEMREVLEDNRIATGLIQGILDSLQALATSDPGTSEPVDVGHVVALTGRMVRRRLEQRHQRLRARVAGSPRALATPIEVTQILLNLLTNASQAGPVGSEVRLTAFERDGHVFVHVRDEGPGVHGEQAERIFQPFQTTKRTGMGLGLSISREMARRHGGELRVVPHGGRGAWFELRLRAARPSCPPPARPLQGHGG